MKQQAPREPKIKGGNRPTSAEGRSLRFVLLGPLSIIVALLLLSFAYLIGGVSSQFKKMKSTVDANIQLTDLFFDIQRNQAKHREALIEFQADANNSTLNRIYQLQARRASLIETSRATGLLTPENDKVVEEYRSGFDALRTIDRQFFEAVQAGDKQQSAELLESLLSLREINDARLSDLLVATRFDLSVAEQAVDDLFDRSFLYVGLMLASAIAGLWFTTVLYRKKVLGPLNAITSGLRRATAGDLSHKVRLGPAPLELEEAASSFNTMSSSLQRANAELKDAQLAALGAVEAQAKFLANISHDIRTPMNTIVGIVDLLDRSDLSQRQKEFVSVLKKSGQILLGLINDFLDHARLEANELQLEHSPFDLDEIISRAAEIIRPLAEGKGLNLRVEASESLPSHIYGDARRLEQILMNLMSNAAKFTERGLISLKASSSRSDGEQWLQLVVEDTGIGIEKDFIPKLFERFSQNSGSPTSHLGGTGLGLSIVRQLVELMDGKIDVESTRGRGTRFTVSIPVETAPTPEKDLAGAPVDPGRIVPAEKFRRLLLVDDVSENRFLVRAFLHESGMDIFEAENGKEAIDLFFLHKPDIVFMDMRMPVLDGFEATREIRKREAAQSLDRIPIIALTASALPEEIQQTKDAGCDMHLIKPLRIPDLQRALTIEYQ